MFKKLFRAIVAMFRCSPVEMQWKPAEQAQVAARQASRRQVEPAPAVARQDTPRPVKAWQPGVEHSKPHPVKENADGTIYYKGEVYRKIGEHSGSKRRSGNNPDPKPAETAPRRKNRS